MKRSKPTIALVTDAVAPYHRGGKEERYRELAPRLAVDADVHVYTMRWWSEGPTVEHDGVTYHALTPLFPLYRGNRRSVVQAVVFAIGCFRLMTARYDVLEADHMPYLQLFVLRLVTWIRRKRFVVTWHEAWGREQWIRYLGQAGRFAWALERIAGLLPDCIVAASPETAHRLRALMGTRVPIVTAPNGINRQQIRAAMPAESRCDVISVGRMLAHKRFDLVVAAVAELAASGTRISCRLIGDGPERSSLVAQARALGVEDLISVETDVRSQEHLYSLVKAARCFVFPSEREGFGIAALEALACGVPVITTNAPDNLAQHLVGRSSMGVVCEPAALASAIESVLSSPAPDVGDSRWIDDYDWDRSAASLLQALQIADSSGLPIANAAESA